MLGVVYSYTGLYVLKLREHGEASRLREPAVHGRLLAGLTLLTWPAYYAPTLLVNGALHSAPSRVPTCTSTVQPQVHTGHHLLLDCANPLF